MALKKGASAGAKAAAANRAKAGSAASGVKAQNKTTFGTTTSKPTSSGSKTIQLNGQTVTATPYSQLNNSNPSSLKTTDTSATNQVRYINSKTGQSKLSLGGSAGAKQLERQGYTLEGTTPTATDVSVPDVYTPYKGYKDELNSLVNAPYAKNAALGKGLGLKFETSAESYMKDKLRQQREELDYQENLKAQQDRLEASDIQAQEKVTRANIAGAEQAFGQNREGLTSAGNAQVVGKFTSEANRRFALVQERGAIAERERGRIIEKLQQAQKNDNYAMIDQYRAELADADNRILQNAETTAAIQASQASTDKIKQENLFTNLEVLGSAVANLDTTQLQAMGDNAGISLPQMNNLQKAYQLRAQAAEQKDQASADLLTAQADELEQSVKFQQEDRPLDIRFKEAETKVKEAEANGVILDPIKRLEYAQLLADSYDASGEGEVLIPGGTKYSVTPTGTGISIGAQNGEYGGQCGKFVNDVLGIPSFIQNSYEQKLSLINSQVAVPGAVGVMASAGDAAPYGHVVMVEKINSDGTLSIVESNGVTLEKVNGRNVPEKVGRRNIPVTSFDGFIIPSNSKPTVTQGTKGLDSATITSVNQKARGTGEKKYSAKEKQVLNEIESVFTNPNSDLLTMLPLTAGGKDPVESQVKTIQTYDKVLSGVARLESTIAQSDPGGVFTAVKKTLQSKLPFVNENERVKAQITALLPQIARGVYGEVGVLTDQDIDRYRQLLPSLKTTEQIQKSLIDLLRSSLYDGVEADLGTLARAKVDVSRFTGQVQQLRDSKQALSSSPAEEDEIAGYLQSAANKPVAPEEDSLIDNEINAYFNNR